MSGSVLAGGPGKAGRTPPQELYHAPHWYACYTRARHEKQVEAGLRERGFDSYLPLVSLERQWKDRKKVVPFPLFPSYVFGRFTLNDLHVVLSTRGVSTIVKTNGYPTPIPEADIANVRLFAEAVNESGLQPEPRTFVSVGEWVRVQDGPFAGVEGIVIEPRGRTRVLVGLAAIGQGLEIDIDARLLKPIRR